MKRRYVKVADAMAGIGWSRGYWTKSGVREAADNLWQEYGPAVWIYTAKEKSLYNNGNGHDGTDYKTWLARNYSK